MKNGKETGKTEKRTEKTDEATEKRTASKKTSDGKPGKAKPNAENTSSERAEQEEVDKKDVDGKKPSDEFVGHGLRFCQSANTCPGGLLLLCIRTGHCCRQVPFRATFGPWACHVPFCIGVCVGRQPRLGQVQE